MTRRFAVLNLLLLGIAVWLGFRLNRDWHEYWRTHDVAALKPLSEPEPLKYLEAAAAARKPVDVAEVGTRNPFSFDRNDTPLIRPPAQAAAPARPRPTLFGTLSLGTERIAMLGPGDSRERHFRSLKMGESIDGWTVVDILSKSVVVENNGHRETVIMNDPTAQPPRDYSRTLAANPVMPVQNTINDASRTAVPSANNGSAVSQPPLPAAIPGKTKVIQTPFGNKVVPDP